MCKNEFGGGSDGVIDGDRGVRGVAGRCRYVSWDGSSDFDGGAVGVVFYGDDGEGEGGRRDVDGHAAQLVDGGGDAVRWAQPAEVVFDVAVWRMAGWRGGGVGEGSTAAKRVHTCPCRENQRFVFSIFCIDNMEMEICCGVFWHTKFWYLVVGFSNRKHRISAHFTFAAFTIHRISWARSSVLTQ